MLKTDIRIQEFEKLTKFPSIFCAPTDHYVNFNRATICLPTVLTVPAISFFPSVKRTQVVYLLLICEYTIIMVVLFFCNGTETFSKVKPCGS